MRKININGQTYDEIEMRRMKDSMLTTYRITNSCDAVENLCGKDAAYEAYKKEIDDFLEVCSLDDIDACCDKNERIELAQLRRRDGHGAWEKINECINTN